MWLSCSKTITTNFKWRFGLEIEMPVTDFIFSSYQHEPLSVWINRGLPLGGSGSGHMSLACLVLEGHVAWSRGDRKLTTTDVLSAPFSLEEVENSPSGAISFLGILIEREADSVLNVGRHFWNISWHFVFKPHRHDIPTLIWNGVLENVGRHFGKKPNILVGLESWSNQEISTISVCKMLR